MFEDALQEQLFQSSTLIPAFGFIIAAIAVVAAMSFVVPAISRRMIPAPKATRLGDHIKFEQMDKEGRVIIGDSKRNPVRVLSWRSRDPGQRDAPREMISATASMCSRLARAVMAAVVSVSP